MRMNIIVAFQFCGNEAARDVPDEHGYNPLIRVGRFRILGWEGKVDQIPSTHMTS